METVNELLTAPAIKYLRLVSHLVHLMLLVHLPYMGMVLGSSVLSAAYVKFKPGLAKDFINLAMGRTWTWTGFGLLPAAALAMLYKMLLFNAPIPIHLFILRIMGLMLTGFILLTLYRRTGHIIFGALGALAILGYCFHLVNFTALLVFPEKWFLLEALIPYPLFAITPLIHFGGFLFLSLIITGAAILFFYYRWPEKRLAEDSPHYDLMKYHGLGLVLAGSLSMPVIILWDLYTLPAYALSIPVFVVCGIIVALLGLTGYLAAASLKNKEAKIPRASTAFFLLALALFGLITGKDRTLQANAGLETLAVLEMEAQAAHREILAQREELYAKGMKIDAALGEKIYNERCTACHTFGKKVLGPPLNSVLPKYMDKQEELAAFLKKPRKIDPNYPAMPNPGLTTIQIKSVVKFLAIKMGAAEAGKGSDDDKD
jgi:cytochrome c551/c552